MTAPHPTPPVQHSTPPVPPAAPQAQAQTQAQARGLDAVLGDPWDASNPLGFAAVLDADERGELPAAGEKALTAAGLAEEFVPRSLGGRLTGVEGLVQVMRAIFRRDPTLGLGYGITSFIAAVPVWTDGSPAQRDRLAGLLLGGERAAAAFTELAHGADFTRVALRADPAPGGGFLVTGAKQLINNIARSRAVTLFARTSDDPGSRSHSTLLLDLADAPPDSYRVLPRFPTSGLRASLLAGIDFDRCPVPEDSVVGERGAGLETALRAFQVTRTALPAIVVGVLDTQLRLAAGFAGERVLYGRPVADLPQSRACLTGALADLLVCDAFSGVAGRALHLLPDRTSVVAAASKYVVSTLMESASYELSVLLGARSYLREGPYGLFQKYQRDLAVTALAHASAAACLSTIIPQLPRLARRSWLRADPAGPELFRLGEELPELDFSLLAADARGADSLTAALALADLPELAPLRDVFLGELAGLRERCVDLPPRERTVSASAETFALAERYSLVLAAGACAGVWAARRDPFTTAWLLVALGRLADRLGLPHPPPPPEAGRLLFSELVARRERSLTFDFSAHPLARHGR
ncbi:acyl-CoA dehydrogenase [Nonomuraea sp. FMUSA5-5]|uniref:Acyl-CoA dehydrogenase n=1 Tax=Nonomuraea composti TaxID=2720023 RepID=A0ABX1BNN8_9ACTN|nr:acyl-CoA dehydrogenase family protein [Nonomuraea sp. FMUSA5-5]NJP96373.1 acyl-CoA dehydrogenase [Nonomuraea sp. FMUSA5-5]